MLVFLTMFMIGILLGFIGAGGSGIMIAVLTTIFGVSVHTALGTSLSAMVFSSLTGAYSHIRESNVVLRIGISTGLFGALGALIGSHTAQVVSGSGLKWLTASALSMSTILLWIRVFTKIGRSIANFKTQSSFSGAQFWFASSSIGVITGTMSGLFGIGAAPFIQVCLLIFFGLSVQKAAGTTMFIIIPIALMGGIGYYTIGYLDIWLFFKVVTGSMLGSYLGAKFTRRVNTMVLKVAMVTSPIAGAVLLLLGN